MAGLYILNLACLVMLINQLSGRRERPIHLQENQEIIHKEMACLFYYFLLSVEAGVTRDIARQLEYVERSRMRCRSLFFYQIIYSIRIESGDTVYAINI